jgi:hypothetical protein
MSSGSATGRSNNIDISPDAAGTRDALEMSYPTSCRNRTIKQSFLSARLTHGRNRYGLRGLQAHQRAIGADVVVGKLVDIVYALAHHQNQDTDSIHDHEYK